MIDSLISGFSDNGTHFGKLTEKERNWATLSHLGFIFNLLILFGGIVVPILILILKSNDDTSQFIKFHAKRALNYQLALYIFYFALIFVIPFALPIINMSSPDLGLLPIFALCIPILIFSVISLITSLGLPILAAIAAYRGRAFKYPFSPQFVR